MNTDGMEVPTYLVGWLSAKSLDFGVQQKWKLNLTQTILFCVTLGKVITLVCFLSNMIEIRSL